MNMRNDGPDLAGVWVMHCTALAPDGSALYDYHAELIVTPNDDTFSVSTQTLGIKSSRSISFAEKLTCLPSNQWHLRYGYEADPEHPATPGHSFFGVAQLNFSADLQNAEGTSCNYNGRYIVTQLSARRLSK